MNMLYLSKESSYFKTPISNNLISVWYLINLWHIGKMFKQFMNFLMTKLWGILLPVYSSLWYEEKNHVLLCGYNPYHIPAKSNLLSESLFVKVFFVIWIRLIEIIEVNLNSYISIFFFHKPSLKHKILEFQGAVVSPKLNLFALQSYFASCFKSISSK